jgi:hypothetical protein
MFYFERDVCAIIDDMDRCCKTLNFSILRGLLAELKMMVDRAENFESMKDQYESYVKFLPKLKIDITKLRNEVNELEKKRDELLGKGTDDNSPFKLEVYDV